MTYANNLGELRPLVRMLIEAGVALPAKTRAAYEALAVLDDDAHFAHSIPDDLGALTPTQLIAAVDHVTFMRQFDSARRDTRGHFQESLARAIAADLAEHADEILDQLRPTFTEAARAVLDAHAVGIRAWHTAEDIFQLEAGAPALWQQLAAAAEPLDEIAALRLRLARATGSPPALDQESAAFCSASGAWNDSRRFRNSWSRWLALVDYDLRLSSAEQTREACQRPRKAPIAASNEHLYAGPEPGMAVFR